MKHLKDQRKC